MSSVRRSALALLAGSSLLASSIASAAAPPVPGPAGGPFDRVFLPQNTPPAASADAGPQAWTTIYGGPGHNAAFAADPKAAGVTWRYAEARAWPLEKPAFDSEFVGPKSAETTAAQWQGNAVGVSVADGVVFAASSDQFIYALNARTGALIWRTSPVGTTFMGQPLVDNGRVFVNAGTVGFNYSNVQAFAKAGMAVRGAGVAYNGIYALDQRDGALLWRYGTAGDAMPTPAITGDQLIFSTGAGDVTSLNKTTGAKLWKASVGGMGNMSSPAIAEGRVFVGMASPAFLFALDAATGQVAWKATIPNSANTGMGDVSPAVADGIVVTDAVSDAKIEAGKATMDVTIAGFDAGTGRMLWSHKMGRGPKPPSYKGGVPMIHDGVVYVGGPVRSEYQALDLKSGRLLWTWTTPNPSEAGSARGPATWVDGALYISTGPSIYKLDAATGRLLARKDLGGRFGISGPTIVGGTMYLGNDWDWVMAEPLAALK